MASGWKIERDATGLTLCRAGARRMDLAVVTELPALRPAALAHEVRKDLWRALQGLRGFSPVIRVDQVPQGLRVTAGGQVDARTWPRQKCLTEIETLLSNPSKRARWIAHARLR